MARVLRERKGDAMQVLHSQMVHLRLRRLPIFCSPLARGPFTASAQQLVATIFRAMWKRFLSRHNALRNG